MHIQKINMVSHIIDFFILVILCSCSQSNERDKIATINIEANVNKMQQVNLSSLTASIRYVRLDFNENQPIGAVVIPSFSQNLILVNGTYACLLYDYQGQLLKKIGNRGRGPGEYPLGEVVGFGQDKSIFIKSVYDLFEYDTNGIFAKKYLRSLLIDNQYYLYTVFPVDDSLFLGHVHNSTGQSKFRAVLFNKYGRVVQYYTNYILFDRGREVASGWEGHAHIYKFNNEVFYKGFYDDTLFSLNNVNQLIPRYAFILGKFKEPTSERAKIPPDMGRFIYIWNVFQSEKYLLLKCQFGDNFPSRRLTPKPPMFGGANPSWYNTKNVLGIYNKKEKELVFCKTTNTDNPLYTSGLYNDIDAGPRFFPEKMVNDSTMMMYISVKELKDHVASDDFKKNIPKYPHKKMELEMLTNSLSEFDNPVLMFVTFKK
jgi:hypothetical protein